MDFEGALRARIVDAATGAGSRVTWEERPQAAGLPAVTLQIVGDERPQHLKGFDDLRPTLVQIDCWALSSVSRSLLREAVIAAVVPEVVANGIRFNRAIIEVTTGGGERLETKFIWRARIDITFWWQLA